MTATATGAATRPLPGMEGAAAFLAEQAECLASGLANADDPLAVRAVLRSHDGAHDRWLRLISAAAECGHDQAEALATLYALHGRVAGSLERRRRVAHDDLQAHIRALLARQLRSRTARVIAALPRS